MNRIQKAVNDSLSEPWSGDAALFRKMEQVARKLLGDERKETVAAMTMLMDGSRGERAKAIADCIKLVQSRSRLDE